MQFDLIQGHPLIASPGTQAMIITNGMEIVDYIALLGTWRNRQMAKSPGIIGYLAKISLTK